MIEAEIQITTFNPVSIRADQFQMDIKVKEVIKVKLDKIVGIKTVIKVKVEVIKFI